MGSFSKMRAFTCLECKQTHISNKTTGRLPLYCDVCKPLIKARTLQALKLLKNSKACLYRHCGRQFIDTSGKGQDYCIKEHARREASFRLGKVTDESQFKQADPITGVKPQRTYTCLTCKEQWLPERFPRDQSCLECRTKARTRNCLNCKTSFYDKSPKNRMKLCQKCFREDALWVAKPLSEEGKRDRDNNPFGRYAYGSNAWRGRLGELAALTIFENAIDTNEVCGHTAPYDIACALGTINVRTSILKTRPSGKQFWKFSVPPRKPDYLLLIAFTGTLEIGCLEIANCWLIPKSEYVSSCFFFNAGEVANRLQYEISTSGLEKLRLACNEIHGKYRA